MILRVAVQFEDYFSLKYHVPAPLLDPYKSQMLASMNLPLPLTFFDNASLSRVGGNSCIFFKTSPSSSSPQGSTSAPSPAYPVHIPSNISKFSFTPGKASRTLA